MPSRLYFVFMQSSRSCHMSVDSNRQGRSFGKTAKTPPVVVFSWNDQSLPACLCSHHVPGLVHHDLAQRLQSIRVASWSIGGLTRPSTTAQLYTWLTWPTHVKSPCFKSIGGLLPQVRLRAFASSPSKGLSLASHQRASSPSEGFYLKFIWGLWYSSSPSEVFARTLALHMPGLARLDPARPLQSIRAASQSIRGLTHRQAPKGLYTCTRKAKRHKVEPWYSHHHKHNADSHTPPVS